MKSCLLKASLLLLLFLVCISSVSFSQTLYVMEKTGLQTDYSLAGIRKLTLTPGMLQVVKTGSSSDEYLLEDLRFLSFSEIIIRIDDPGKDDPEAPFRIFPNPAGESMKISATGDKTLRGTIEMINSAGLIVKSQVLNERREQELDLREMEKGLYLCRFYDENKIVTLKFVKQ